MAGERARRSSRPRRSPKDEDSDDPEMSAALQLTRLDGGGLTDQTRESDRLAKIQEKNRKAQQKFRERRKEKMLTMEREIQDLNNAVRQLRAEKDQLQEQLAVEKRVNSENSAKLESKPTTLSMHGLHDYDPIDMSFLPQWEGLSLSNDKIRAMPSDTLKILIQTILQDLRTRLASMDATMSPAVGHSVTQAFSFLNRCYLVEPIRYRKVVVEMMGPGSGSGNTDTKPHINLNRDQELAISAAVETFEKRCDEVWKMRESLCEQVKQTRVSRGSELENMRSFIQVHGHIETLQESLRAENEVLVRFLGDVGRILGPAPLTHALFASGGQDIFTYCQAIHCRALMVNSSSLGSGAIHTPQGSAPGASGSLPGLPAPSPSASWLSGRDAAGSAAMTGSIPLVDNLMMPAMNDSTAMDLDQQMRDRSTNDHSRRLDSVQVPGADGSMHGGIRNKPPSPAPQHQLMHESPFLYGPGERNQAAGVDNGGQAAPAAMPSGFRVPKSEPGVNNGQPLSSGGEFIELFRSVGDGQGRGDSTRLSAGLRSLLKDVPGSLGLQHDAGPFPFHPVDHPPASSDALPAGADATGAAALQPTAELLAGSLAANLQSNGSPAVKGFLSQLLTQQQGQQAQAQAGAGSAAGSNTGAAPNASGRAPNLTELETLLQSKEGSRTLEILAQDLTTTRTLSAGELLSIQPEELAQAAAAQAANPSTPTQQQPEVSAPSSSQSPAAQVISGIAHRPRSSGVAQVTSGQCE